MLCNDLSGAFTDKKDKPLSSYPGNGPYPRVYRLHCPDLHKCWPQSPPAGGILGAYRCRAFIDSGLPVAFSGIFKIHHISDERKG